MKIIKNLTFAAWATLAVALLLQTQITRASDNGKRSDDNERGDRDDRDAKVTFTKWIVDKPNLPGRIYNMAGVVGGDIGDGSFTGEVLFRLADPVTGVTEIVAFYHFNGNGTEHDFTALVHVVATGGTPGSTAVITGVVTDGWLKGHAVEGEYTVIMCDHNGTVLTPTTCFEGSLEIERNSND